MMASRFLRYMPPLIKALQEFGGSERPKQVLDAIRNAVDVPQEDLDNKHKSGQTIFYNDVHWCREYLKKAGYIDASQRGMWALTAKGQECVFTTETAKEVVRTVQEQKRLRAAVKSGGGIQPDIEKRRTVGHQGKESADTDYSASEEETGKLATGRAETPSAPSRTRPTDPAAMSQECADSYLAGAKALHSSLDSPIESFHGYDLLQEFKTGGMAEAYKARNRDTGEIVFLKRVRRSSADKDSLDREIAIYEKLMRLPLQHVLKVLDFVRDDQYVVLITEFADGGDLHDYVQRHNDGRGLPVSVAKRIAISVVTALKELHAREIVHRDLKPQNVLLHRGEWKLADFGISKNVARLLTRGRTFREAGTPGYMAPEQLRGVEAHPSADLYSLGKLLVFLLTGQTDPDKVPFTYREWDELIRRCLKPSPARRLPIPRLIRGLKSIPT
jgi:hypothetical protein